MLRNRPGGEEGDNQEQQYVSSSSKSNTDYIYPFFRYAGVAKYSSMYINIEGSFFLFSSSFLPLPPFPSISFLHKRQGFSFPKKNCDPRQFNTGNCTGYK